MRRELQSFGSAQLKYNENSPRIDFEGSCILGALKLFKLKELQKWGGGMSGKQVFVDWKL